MSLKRTDFLDAYNAVSQPATIQSVDSIGAEAAIVADTFFRDIRNSLGLGALSVSYIFQRDIKILTPGLELIESGTNTASEIKDYIDFFRLAGGQVLASAMFVRDENEYQIAHFAKFPLTDSTVGAVRALHTLERFHDGLIQSLGLSNPDHKRYT